MVTPKITEKPASSPPKYLEVISPGVPPPESALASHSDGLDSELVVVVAGPASCRVGSSGVELAVGDAWVASVASELERRSSDAPQLQLLRVRFRSSQLAVGASDLCAVPGYLAFFKFERRLRARHGLEARLRLSSGALKDVVELVSKLEGELTSKKPGFEQVSGGLLCTLGVELARHYANMTAPLPEALVRLSPALEWLDEHFEGPMTLEDIVAAGEMSQSTLQRCFRRCFGSSPLNYVLELRMDKARHLLRNTEAKVKEIAPKVGIEDANYFTRRFRQHAGVEPTAYRARYRASGDTVTA